MKIWLWCLTALAVFTIGGCDTNNIVDENVELSGHNWSYVDRLKAVVDVKDPSKAYAIYFKLRHTANYSYSNIYVLLHLKGPDQKKVVKRFQYKLAEPDGQWTGSGSGNLFTHEVPLLTHYHFPTAGKYEIQIEQNMRDNPLKEVSDVGLTVSTY